MSRRHDSDSSSSDDEEQGDRRRRPQAKSHSINELLRRALADAANPGIGDEDPEVLPAPNAEAEGKSTGDEHDEEKEQIRRSLRQEEAAAEIARKAMEEEERRVANLSFNEDELLPCDDMRERAKYIPLRLTYEERKHLRLVNAAINVSDYTTTVDVAFKNKAKRHHTQLQYIVAFMTGLIAARDYRWGQEAITDRNFVIHQAMLQEMLEIARRYKITNPEKMRSEYGKLVYLIQDAVSDDIKPLLGVDISSSIRTVYDTLQAAGGLKILSDEHIATATEEILPDKIRNRAMIDLEIKRKERAANIICKRYASPRLPEEMIRSCLYSISDNNSFLNSNKRPIEECRKLLVKYFSPDIVEPAFSLSINEGSDGARLSHTHELQYNYVYQSLTLWAKIVEDMFRLWYLSELDLLSEAQPYELTNTGQGLQRVQSSPHVYRAMHELLHKTQQDLGNKWVGSSVIHLGDHNVPNALVFIDKYTQVSRILGPLVKTLENIETACEENAGLTRYIQAYGGLEKAKKIILQDFFTHAFDGSGGDNFFDAGSCIDGRLTSAWHWCSQLSSKPYYPLFRLTGFLSFDGQFDS